VVRAPAHVRRRAAGARTFRRRLPDADRPYRVPAATVLAPGAFVVANLLILWSGWKTAYKLGIAMRHPWFPLWWDMLVVTAFSLAIFFWTMHVALPTEKIEELIEGGAREDSPVLEQAA
jgi:amino acid transporter